jgi:UDP-N-acetylmuramoyl-L-alanyl-D-glutamate--2,6-diaminopimelate ligase
VNAAGRPTIEDLIHGAEPREPRPLGQVIDRIAEAGGLVGAREGGRPIGPAAIGGIPVRSITADSRQVAPGALFVAVRGQHHDGHEFLDEVAALGAAGAIVEEPLPTVALPQVVVPDSRRALASAAAWWYGDPSHELGVIGVTGTDGKTTTSLLAVAALEAAGIPTGLVATVETKIGTSREANAEHATTPEALRLQATLRAMARAGDRAAVIETTSHGLALDRVAQVAYDVAILTNLTHEHLEFHGSWEAYRDAKLSLFERLSASRANPLKARLAWPKSAIVNADDPSAGLFAGAAQEAGARVVTYGTDAAADVRALRVSEDARALRIAYAAPSGEARLELRLSGRFNLYNALAVVALGEALDLDRSALRAGLEGVQRIPGRMERISAGQPFEVVIDYAHTPAALEQVLEILAPTAAARDGTLIAVFGSAGERDTAKRPMMGRIAGERCRLVILTDEDPRGEDREAILREIAAGAEAAAKQRGHDLLLIADRNEAIAAAFERARPGDVVLLAGKGHEQSIIGPDGPAPWDERGAALAALRALGYGT